MTASIVEAVSQGWGLSSAMTGLKLRFLRARLQSRFHLRNLKVSKCNPKTGHRVLMSKREQEAFTQAYVILASRGILGTDERKTLRKFRDTWFKGNDFDGRPGYFGTLHYFVELAAKYKVPIQYMRRPSARRGHPAGEMYLAQWSEPDLDGSCWPAPKKGEDWKVRMEQKRRFRIRIAHEAMAKHEIYDIDLGDFQIALKEAVERASAEKPEPLSKPEPKTIPADLSNVVPIFGRPEFEWREIDFGECPVEWRTYSYGVNDNERVAA